MNDETLAPPPPVKEFDPFAALAYGWRQFLAHFGGLLVVTIAPIVVTAALLLVGFLAVHSVAGSVVFVVLATLVSHAAYIGLFNAALMITAGEPFSVGKAFSTDRWGQWIVFSLLYGLLLGIGMIPCGIGALLVIAFFGLAPFAFLDEGESIAGAFRASWATTRSHPHLPFALAVTAVVAYAGVVLFFIPALVTYPIALVAAAALYRQAHDQPVAP